MKPVLNFTVRALRKIIGNKSHYHPLKYYAYVDLYNQQANNYIYEFLINENSKGKMISKFGTIELSNIVAYHYKTNHWTINYLKDVISYNADFRHYYIVYILCGNKSWSFPKYSYKNIFLYGRRNFYKYYNTISI